MARLSPLIRSGMVLDFPSFLPFHLSPDPALNRLSRPLSLPDRKSSLEKGEGGIVQSISRRDSGSIETVFAGSLCLIVRLLLFATGRSPGVMLIWFENGTII